ncbi:MAG: hypothetical protein EAX96_06025 [Candidatus Lokiarchaeota archaeon]|nr:hypothetical protein [Candidatus Lokiarchaeota archaeon]
MIVKFSFLEFEHPNKEYMLLAPHMYKCFKELGADYIESLFPKFDEIQYDLIKERWDNMISTSRLVVSGKFTQEETSKMMLYTLPHVISTRTDLQTGLVKLLYGDSVDVTAIMLNDLTGHVVTCMNGHEEQGISVDWWNVGMNDELLERRHRKLGVKIKDIYNKTKNVAKTARLILDVMKDIRNERTPQWSTSLYSIVMLHTSGLFNFFVEPSNYEVLGSVWDGYNSKKYYGMKDHWFLFYPDLPLINSMALTSRGSFISRLGGLTSGKALCIHTIEDPAIDWIHEDVPEAYPAVVQHSREIGVPVARMTLECNVAGKDNLLTPNEELNRKYPSGTRVKAEDINVTEREFYKGFLTNVMDDAPIDIKVTEKNLVSKNFGKNTTFY